MLFRSFGLARVRLADGDRAGAVDMLHRVEPASRHYDAARVAAVRVLCGTLPTGDRPSEADLATASERLAALYLDGGAETGEARTRLLTVLREAELGTLLAEGGADAAREFALRERLEHSYRVLARQAGTRAHRSDLVDLANRHRPITTR